MKKMSLPHVLLLWIVTTASVNAQFTFKSVLVDDAQKPIVNASVIIKDTYLAALSNANGEVFFKNLNSGKYIIQVKCLGCVTITDTLSLNSDIEKTYTLKTDSKQLDEVIVNTTRVNSNSGIAFSNLSGDDISKTNLGKDALILMDQLPSVVVNSDAGNGVGYTGIRIRGSDQTRINVTINGVPVNDAESQGTFFVNMPDFISSVDNVQVQRGVGASSNGAGAFGGTINFQTNTLKPKAYGQISSSAGSFNTYKNTIAAGTGLLNNKYSIDARASMINSDGYIDRATSRLGSLYLSAAYYGKKDVLKFIGFTGIEKTYQAWYYVDADSFKKGNRTDNPAGLYFDANGNARYYKNETDNYQQDNYQLHYARTINNKLNFNVIAHYTKG
ncbi:MAG: TonB-dependent receptor, partial [Bacteroidia bacterium]|nr:TonB-dependent receptor [Bacteroidia bacterium]